MILDMIHKKNRKKTHGKDPMLYEVGAENTDTPTTDQTKTDTVTPTTTPVTYNTPLFGDTDEGKEFWKAYEDAVIARDKKREDGFTYSNSLYLDSIMGQILAGQNFKYDFNEDAMYQQYKDAYARQAKLASQDVMGQAAAMTGGYGNSYAASVGNQAYQAELGKLNDVIPELYQLALDRHNMEQNKLMQKYSVYADDYNREYTQYLNDLSALDDSIDDTLREYNVKAGEYYDKQGFDRDQIWRNEDIALNMLYGNNEGDEGDEEVYPTAKFSKTDELGYNIYYVDGNAQAFAPGFSPYTGTKNKDIENGTFDDNDYQPNNVGGKELTDTKETDVINGERQKIYKTTDGTKWIWDKMQNEYREYIE